MTLERTILTNLIHNEDYLRKVIPFIKSEYFLNEGEKKIFTLISSFFDKYNKLPTVEAVQIDLLNSTDLNEHSFKESKDVLNSLNRENVDFQWLLDKTEKFCQEKALYLAILTSYEIISEEKKHKQPKTAIPKILEDALAVSFDTSIGHDFIDDYESRFDFYHQVFKHIPFDIELLNKITNGGVIKKTLNCILASTGVGKTLAMCHMAANNLRSGYNVLYITLEMAEEKIAERIDSNLLDVTLEDLQMISKDAYTRRIEKLKTYTKSKLIIKEYPTVSAGANHFRYLLNELKTKKNFVPDIIYIDYINLCMSSRLRLGNNVNSYTYIKSIAEEIRGLAVEFDVPIMTATQTNRDGAGNSDFDMTQTSDSFGLPMALDLMFALISTEELVALDQILVKQLKNRYSDVNKNKRFVIGVDKSKMRLYNLENQAQEPEILPNKTKMDRKIFDDFK